MEIIGAGFGRTGTTSLRVALRMLGFGPCYHMLEVFAHPSHIRVWQAAADGHPVDWPAFLAGYRSGLDYPLVAFYRDLLAEFPNAKVILTVRDPDRWYESTKETIYRGTAVPFWVGWLLPPYRNLQRMADATIWDWFFEGRFEDRDHAIRVYEEHIRQVKQDVPASQLLVYRVSDGWGPLCQFLGVPVPEAPFPHVNDRRTTRRLYLLARLAAVLPAAVTVVVAFRLLRRLFCGQRQPRQY